jgi:hypothetical protein
MLILVYLHMLADFAAYVAFTGAYHTSNTVETKHQAGGPQARWVAHFNSFLG